MSKDVSGKVEIKGIVKGGLTNKGKVSFNNISYPSLSQNNGASSQASNAKQEKEISDLKSELAQFQKKKKELEEQHERDLSSAKEAGKQEGIALGIAQGREEAEAEIQAKVESLQQDIASAFQSMGQEKETFYKDLFEGTQKAMLLMLSRIVGPLSENNTDIVKNVVKIALAQLGNESSLKIHVAPIEHEYVDSEKGLWIDIDKKIDHLEVVADERVSVGGCIIETEAGSIDARIETMLSQMETTIQSCFSKTTPEAELDVPIQEGETDE